MITKASNCERNGTPLFSLRSFCLPLSVSNFFLSSFAFSLSLCIPLPLFLSAPQRDRIRRWEETDEDRDMWKWRQGRGGGAGEWRDEPHQECNMSRMIMTSESFPLLSLSTVVMSQSEKKSMELACSAASKLVSTYICLYILRLCSALQTAA